MSCNDKMIALKFDVSASKFLIDDMIALWNSDRRSASYNVVNEWSIVMLLD